MAEVAERAEIARKHFPDFAIEHLMQQRFAPSWKHARAIFVVIALLFTAGCARLHPQHANRDPHGPRDVDAYIRSLEDPARDRYQMPDAVLRTLSLAPDAVVADVGCGPGYFTRRLARAVPQGVVYAVDIEPQQLDRLNQHLGAEQTTNVVPVLATGDDPRLPPGRLDLILVVDTYHHFENRPPYLAKLVRALKPDGRLVVIDYHKHELPVGPPVAHKIAREQVLQETQAAGFRVIDEPTFLPYQYFLIFARPQ
jgi:SAM-dependent methyltransferase